MTDAQHLRMTEALLFAAARSGGRSGGRAGNRSGGRAGNREERLGDSRIERVRTVRGHLDLKRVFARLGELAINDVLVEAGPRLGAALLAAGLVDEWLVYLAPTLLGRDARPLTSLAGLTRLASTPRYDILDTQPIGPDLRLRLRPWRRVGKSRSP